MWFIFFLLCNGASGFLVYQSIFSYLSFDVFVKFKVVFPQTVSFPAVSICNANPFQSDQAFAFVGAFLAKNNISDPAALKFDTDSYATEVNQLLRSYNFVQLDAQVNALAPNVSDATRQSFGSNLTDLVLSCYFNSGPCALSDFEWFYDSTYGNCFKYNGDSTKFVAKPGNLNGLTLIMLTRVNKTLNSLTKSMGSRIFIHNQTIKPSSAEGINVAPGTQTNIELSIAFINQLGFPYNQCNKDLIAIDAYDSDLYRTIISNNRTYRQSDCFQLCVQQQVVKSCQCYSTDSLKIGDFPPCTSLTQLDCVVNVSNDFYSSNVNDRCGDLW